MTGAVDNLVRVADILRQTAPADPATAWLESGVQEFLQVGGPRLDEALGLRQKTNSRTPATSWLFRRRDFLIREATARCADVGDFLGRLDAFELHEWPTVQRMSTPPHKWSSLQRDFFALLRVGVPIPRGRRRLQQIIAVRETSSGSGCADALSLLSTHDRKKRSG